MPVRIDRCPRWSAVRFVYQTETRPSGARFVKRCRSKANNAFDYLVRTFIRFSTVKFRRGPILKLH